MKIYISEKENSFEKHKIDYYINIVIHPPKNIDYYAHLHRIYEGTLALFCGNKSWNYDQKTGVVVMQFEMKNDIGQLVKILSWYDADTEKVNTYV
jgi:hypothetical protein